MEQTTVTKGFAIVVADCGWIFVGDVEHDGVWCRIRNARNIRRWGTEHGLGQIAKDGPTEATVLDDYGAVQIPAHAVLAVIDAERTKWTP